MKAKKTKLQKFKEDFEKFMQKHPEIQIYGNQNGDAVAYHFDGVKTHSIYLKNP